MRERGWACCRARAKRVTIRWRTKSRPCASAPRPTAPRSAGTKPGRGPQRGDTGAPGAGAAARRGRGGRGGPGLRALHRPPGVTLRLPSARRGFLPRRRRSGVPQPRHRRLGRGRPALAGPGRDRQVRAPLHPGAQPARAVAPRRALRGCHCDSGPAFGPIRSSWPLAASRRSAIAADELSTVASRTKRPLASGMQTAVVFTETSRPTN